MTTAQRLSYLFRSCSEKQKVEEEDLQRIKNIMSRRHGMKFFHYECKICGSYHLSKNKSPPSFKKQGWDY